MRSVSIFILAVAYIVLCQSCKSNGLPIKKEALPGNWIVIRTKSSADYNYELITGQKVSDVRKKTELSIFRFQLNGKGDADMGQPEYKIINWTINPDQQLGMQISEPGKQENNAAVRPRNFTTQYYESQDSLIIQNVLKNNEYDSVIVSTFFLRLKSNDTIPDLFQPALNKWREKAVQAESDDAIRARLKQVLNYYSVYFASLKFNKVRHFNTTKILCPVTFYSGGLGVKHYKGDDDWTKVFYDSLDAKKAHDMLNQAFSKVHNYPNKGDDFVQEYIIALKLVGDKL